MLFIHAYAHGGGATAEPAKPEKKPPKKATAPKTRGGQANTQKTAAKAGATRGGKANTQKTAAKAGSTRKVGAKRGK